jgi:hypothetical protein
LIRANATLGSIPLIKKCVNTCYEMSIIKEVKILDFLQASIIHAKKYINKEDALRHVTSYAAYTPINMDKNKGKKQ